MGKGKEAQVEGTAMKDHLMETALAACMMFAVTCTAYPQDSTSRSGDPVTASQLTVLLDEEQIGDAETPLIHDQLERKRTTLPTWFPKAVWDDVEHKVEAIKFADTALPTYQKYMTKDQADALILLYQGPTGQAIASTLAHRANVAAEAGHTGSDADQQVAKTMQGDSGIQALFIKRFSELSPSQVAHVRSRRQIVRHVPPLVACAHDVSHAVEQLTKAVLPAPAVLPAQQQIRQHERPLFVRYILRIRLTIYFRHNSRIMPEPNT